MLILFLTIIFTLLVIETLLGMAANGFIVLVNSIDWFRSKKICPGDLILTCLGLSRTAWLVVMILDRAQHFFSPDKHIWNETHLLPPIIWIFTSSINIWIAAWLSVFYFAKIAIFTHPVFLQVKQRISGMVPWLLLGSGVFSAMTAIIVMGSLNDGFSMHSPSNGSENKAPDTWKYLDILYMAPNVIPFLIFLSSSILLITSLQKHMKHMRCNGIGIRDFNTQVHFTAIKVLASFAVLYLSSFLAVTSQAVLIWKNMDHSWSVGLLDMWVAAYYSGHSIILILINPKLKQTWVRILRRLKCCLRGVPS